MKTTIFFTALFLSSLQLLGQFTFEYVGYNGYWYYPIPSQNTGLSIGSDGAGAAYVLGSYSGEIDLDPAPADTFLLTGMGFYLQKLDAVGNFVWGMEHIQGDLKVDSEGNIFTYGQLFGTVDMDPDSANSFPLTSGGASDVFIQKLDSSGNLVWAKHFGGFGAQSVYDMDMDSLGNFYLFGTAGDSTDFDPGPGTYYADSSYLYILKLDANGDFVWVTKMGNPPGGMTGGLFPTGISVDPVGNVYTLGSTWGTVDFDPGPGVFPHVGVGMYIHKLDTAGNFIWVKTMGNSGISLHPKKISVDPQGHASVTGELNSGSLPLDADPGPDTFLITQPTTFANTVFVINLDAAGNFFLGQTICQWRQLVLQLCGYGSL